MTIYWGLQPRRLGVTRRTRRPVARRDAREPGQAWPAGQSLCPRRSKAYRYIMEIMVATSSVMADIAGFARIGPEWADTVRGILLEQGRLDPLARCDEFVAALRRAAIRCMRAWKGWSNV